MYLQLGFAAACSQKAGQRQQFSFLVCPETDLPAAVLQCERGWRALKICGVLDFALVGILAKISSLLANAGISIFAVSTYNTDYIFIKESHLQKAAAALRTNGYQITA